MGNKKKKRQKYKETEVFYLKKATKKKSTMNVLLAVAELRHQTQQNQCHAKPMWGGREREREREMVCAVGQAGIVQLVLFTSSIQKKRYKKKT